MPIRTTTTLLLALALTVGALTGCSTLTGYQDCGGSEERVRSLRALAILDTPPGKATPPPGYEEVDAGCWDDSGEAWAYAHRTYAFPGTPEEVLRHYRTAAARDGWRPGRTRSPAAGHAIDLCFTREVEGTPTVLTVYSLTREAFASSGDPFPPELATRSGFAVEATADAAGAATDCAD
ncbi:hypothetical protein PUR59_08155 [Streptomyces sp. SP18ES09]|uniref:hypothetical protein n=1 Tax=Streptomyces sp. SP18ES09 TaxID=3002532 RepID=UPI002E7A9A59|nr:hypothetical protein [Streptomyces sp. SP18ES09]MEE1814984.1 hypothetical protein [Streptomyces sp. SP18ES09]